MAIEVASTDREDLRFAVVMSGGVSLCVWMGGVAREIDRVRRRDPVYKEVLDLTASTSRVDIIAGTSAGGLNGVLLASSIAYGSKLDCLRDVWLDMGGMDKLLRDPFDKEPPSLLKGDEYFYCSINDVLDKIYKDGDKVVTTCVDDVKDKDPTVDVLLTVTTSLLKARSNIRFDDFDQLIPESTNRGLFHFRGDDFKATDARLRLALAARCSAAHPGGFEASLCPIDEETPESPPILRRPDMKGIADWDQTRFVVDGGILENRPLKEALDAIYSQKARREVRRVVLFVVPDPGAALETRPDEVHNPPKFVKTISAAATLPRNQSIAEELDRLQKERRAARVGRRWEEALTTLPRPPEVAPPLYPAYMSAIHAQRVAEIVSYMRFPEEIMKVEEGWKWTEVQLEARLGALLFPGSANEGFPASGAVLTSPWRWGTSLLDTIASNQMYLLAGTLRVTVPQSSGTTSDRARVADIKEQLYAVIDRLHDFKNTDRSYWAGRASAVEPTTDVDKWAVESVARWPEAFSDHPNALLLQLAVDLTFIVLNAIPAVVRTLENSVAPGHEGEAQTLAAGTPTFFIPDFDPNVPDASGARVIQGDPASMIAADAVMRHQLALHVLALPITGRFSTVASSVRLMQVSANTPNAFDRRQLGKEKLTGFQLAHFGAFFKESWRANDWMWGRLDGARRLVLAMLDPARLRRLGYTRESALAAIEAIALGPVDDPLHSVLASGSDSWRASVKRELAYLSGREDPGGLMESAGWIARRLQLQILLDELPKVAATVQKERDAKGAIRDSATRFLDKFNSSLDTEGHMLPVKAGEVLEACKVGRETLKEEQGSDPFIGTATKAAAVGLAVGASERSGLGPLRGALSTLRGYALALYVLAGSVRKRSNAIAGLRMALVVLAASTVVLWAGGKASGLIVTGSVVLLLGVIAFAVLRMRRAEVVASLALTFSGLTTFLLIAVRGSVGLTMALVLAAVAAVVFGMIIDATIRLPLQGKWRATGAVALVAAILGLSAFVLWDKVGIVDPAGKPKTCGSILSPAEFEGNSARSPDAKNCAAALSNRKRDSSKGAVGTLAFFSGAAFLVLTRRK